MSKHDRRDYRKKLTSKIWQRQQTIKKWSHELNDLLDQPQPSDAIVERRNQRGPCTYARRVEFLADKITRSEEEIEEWREEMR